MPPKRTPPREIPLSCLAKDDFFEMQSVAECIDRNARFYNTGATKEMILIETFNIRLGMSMFQRCFFRRITEEQEKLPIIATIGDLDIALVKESILTMLSRILIDRSLLSNDKEDRTSIEASNRWFVYAFNPLDLAETAFISVCDRNLTRIPGHLSDDDLLDTAGEYADLTASAFKQMGISMNEDMIEQLVDNFSNVIVERPRRLFERLERLEETNETLVNNLARAERLLTITRRELRDALEAVPPARELTVSEINNLVNSSMSGRPAVLNQGRARSPLRNEYNQDVRGNRSPNRATNNTRVERYA